MDESTLIFVSAVNTATIAFNCTEPQDANIDVYNTMGQLVYTGSSTVLKPGRVTHVINTENYSDGIYRVVISSDRGLISKKLVIQN